MKNKFSSARHGLMAGALATVLLVACSEPNEMQRPPNAPTAKWMEQVNHALSVATRSATDNQIKLVGYEYAGKVESENEKNTLLADMFADQAYTVIFNDFKTFTDFEIITWEAFVEKAGHPCELHKSKVADLIHIGQTEVINVRWAYGGNVYESVAIANPEEGIVYDNIGTYAIDYGAKDI